MSNKIKLKDAYKTFTEDQDKIMTPVETVKKMKNLFSEIDLDLLEEAKRIDNGRLDIPVYFSICGTDALAATGTKKQMGKGATPEQAEASAIMELAERYSFFSFCKNKNNFITNTYKNIKKNTVPFDIIAKSVHDESEDLELSKRIFEEIEMEWTWGYNLSGNEEVLIPFTWFYTINEFNGPSAGNCQEEAILQGISEIVERHVSSIISHKKLNVPLISPESADDPAVMEMLKKYEKAGIKVFLSDFSLDTGIPSVGVLAYDLSTFPNRSEIVWTAGTTPDPQKALSRALTETAQLAGDFNSKSNYVASGLPKFRNIGETGFITDNNYIKISDLPDISNKNIKVEIENCLAALSRKNMDVILINTMHQQLKVPAFYTIIPGAHFRERAVNTSVNMFSAKIITETSQPDTAIKKLQKIDSMLPGKYFIKFYLGMSYLALYDTETAYNYFNQALELNPGVQDISTVYSYIGSCLKDMGEYEKALSYLKKGKEHDNERTDIFNLMGFCYFKLKEHRKAISCFEEAIELNPSSAIDYANIGSNYRDLGETIKAIQYYKLALEMDPEIEFARQNLKNLQKNS